MSGQQSKASPSSPSQTPLGDTNYSVANWIAAHNEPKTYQDIRQHVDTWLKTIPKQDDTPSLPKDQTPTPMATHLTPKPTTQATLASPIRSIPMVEENAVAFIERLMKEGLPDNQSIDIDPNTLPCMPDAAFESPPSPPKLPAEMWDYAEAPPKAKTIITVEDSSDEEKKDPTVLRYPFVITVKDDSGDEDMYVPVQKVN